MENCVGRLVGLSGPERNGWRFGVLYSEWNKKSNLACCCHLSVDSPSHLLLLSTGHTPTLSPIFSPPHHHYSPVLATHADTAVPLPTSLVSMTGYASVDRPLSTCSVLGRVVLVVAMDSVELAFLSH